MRCKTFMLAVAVFIFGSISLIHAEEVINDHISTEYQDVRLIKMVEDLEHPWAVAFLSQERMLVSERPGRIQLIENGEKTEVSGLPEDLYAVSQGGMLDMVPHPEYDDNGWIYMTYSRGDSEATVPALMRSRLDGHTLVDVENIFESNTYTEPGRHYGSRILFLEDGTLLMTIGDRGAEPLRAQDTEDHSGTIVRLNDDGSVPEDNPFVNEEGYAPEIYTYGHRNIQGIALHPETGEIWVAEHGPRGGDELNLIEAGKNYGWPVQTLGLDYATEDPFPDAETRDHPDMVNPVFEFLPTLAPSGLAVIDGNFDAWQGNLLVGGLLAERALRLVVEDQEVIHAEELFLKEIGRIRDVRQGPDKNIYILNDEPDGGLFRVEPR